MQRVLGFGEKVTGYDVPVLNERELRAAAGLLFVAAFYAFMNAWLLCLGYLANSLSFPPRV